MKVSYLNIFIILLVVGAIIGHTSRSLVAINEENNGKRCIEYNKDLWGQENYRRGCKTWA